MKRRHKWNWGCVSALVVAVLFWFSVGMFTKPLGSFFLAFLCGFTFVLALSITALIAINFLQFIRDNQTKERIKREKEQALHEQEIKRILDEEFANEDNEMSSKILAGLDLE